MKKRKLIGFITSNPESAHCRRILKGMFERCRLYDYDIAVFASMVTACSFYKDYLSGEENIYELINFDILDGVIVDPLLLREGNAPDALEKRILHKLKNECSKPVIALVEPFGNYPVVNLSQSDDFFGITRHAIGHGCTDIMFLSGPKGHAIAEDRLSGFRRAMNSSGLPVTEDSIYYGDFWYPGGAALADEFLSGRRKLPQAVVCASDHMAIGLVNRLAEGGVKIPEQVMITGYDATQEAQINPIPVTTFDSNDEYIAMEAVNVLRSLMEPDAEILPYAVKQARIHTGLTCPCRMEIGSFIGRFRDSLYYLNRDYGTSGLIGSMDIGALLEGYVSERLSGSRSLEECFIAVYSSTYYVRPFMKYWLCLYPDWLTHEDLYHGYPQEMSIVVFTTPEENTGFYKPCDEVRFDRRELIPGIGSDDEASVYYFSSVHFNDRPYGYSVIQCSFDCNVISLVYRNWLRNINNALEMMRIQHSLLNMSMYDKMTGALNRRGMEELTSGMLSAAKPGEFLAVTVVDMDRLKHINDIYGHVEGDVAITVLAGALREALLPGEICVRAGGDEFYLIGVGKYTEEQLCGRAETLRKLLEEKSSLLARPYSVSASMGSSLRPAENARLDSAITAADRAMYEEKVRRHMERTT